MFDSIQALLDNFPEGVVLIRGEVVLSANAMALHYLPQLALGQPLPPFLPLPQGPSGAGVFSSGPASYSFSCNRSGDDVVLLFHPAPQSALTQNQLDGVLYQLRGLLGDFLAEVGPYTAPVPPETPFPASAFSKSFYRSFRLMDNLDYMRLLAAGEIPFAPVSMDLDGLCRQITAQARDLLAQAGLILDYEGVNRGLLIPGDRALLHRAVLELIANSARSTGEGRITLSLRRSGERALLSLSDSGPLPDQRRLTSLFQQGPAQNIPLPSQGAGLGLSIVRDIVSRHKGTMLVEWGQSSPVVVLSLPCGPLDPHARVKAPTLQRDGGLDPTLVALSDVLPSQSFCLDGLE